METEKGVIRKEIMNRRKALDADERRRASIMLTDRICGHQWYYLSENILGFVPYGSEIDISDILQDALQKGKNVYLPKVIGENMQFFKVSSLDSLVEGYKGILEPVGDTEIFEYRDELAEKTLMLMPGVAFDYHRNRIGYGKGYYDRYLTKKETLQLRTIAVGFKCQMVEQIPAEKFDIRPYQIICL